MGLISETFKKNKPVYASGMNHWMDKLYKDARDAKWKCQSKGTNEVFVNGECYNR